MSDILSWLRLPGPFLIGHRGYPGAARENTPLSFEAALEAGCDGVEFDVHLSRDRVPFVHHDSTANGPHGPVHLKRLEWNAIDGMRFHEGGEPYRISRLDDILTGISGRTLLNLEIKPPGPEHQVAMAEAVVAALDRVRPRESVLVSSFDPAMLNILKRVDSSITIGYLFTDISDFNHLEEAEVAPFLTAVHPHHHMVNKKFMKRVGELGLQVHTWTVDEAPEAERLLALGVTSIISNDPRICGSVFY